MDDPCLTESDCQCQTSGGWRFNFCQQFFYFFQMLQIMGYPLFNKLQQGDFVPIENSLPIPLKSRHVAKISNIPFAGLAELFQCPGCIGRLIATQLSQSSAINVFQGGEI